MTQRVLTPWGYEVELEDSATELPPLMDEDAYEAAGGSRASDPRLPLALRAASQAVRNACGWHVSPPLDCTCALSPRGPVLRLPTMALRSVDSVTDGGAEVQQHEYEWRREGLLRRVFGKWGEAWGGVEVSYSSGLDADPALMQAVMQVVDNALTAPGGVREEHAGNAGVTYNDLGGGISGGVTLLDRDMALLAPYRLPGVV